MLTDESLIIVNFSEVYSRAYLPFTLRAMQRALWYCERLMIENPELKVEFIETLDEFSDFLSKKFEQVKFN